MVQYDSTQSILMDYLSDTEQLMGKLLSKNFSGTARIKAVSDLGFPHDVIRIAGGFATGSFVDWTTNIPFIPIDTCVNVCSVSFFEIKDDIKHLFNDDYFDSVKRKLGNGIYISNFHRGNHFISYLNSVVDGKKYLLLHSSANEYKENFNGLYPVEGNWYFDRIKIFSDGQSYVRYLDGKDAEVFYSIAKGLYEFNEIRHEFIAHVILGDYQEDVSPLHFHHYGMPTNTSIAMGCHLSTQDEIFPILTLPGESLYMIKYSRAKDKSLMLSDKQFLTPHGWGKRHISMPKIALNLKDNIFMLDDQSYEIRFGTSLRSHPNIELRDFGITSLNRKENFFDYLSKLYEYEIVDEFEQIASWNKAGVKIWR